MAKVLLTGSSGGVGRAARPVLEAAGWAVQPFDLAEGDDLRNEAAVRGAMTGCAAVVHAGALAHDSAGTPAEIVATNLLGTWHVLQAAETHRVSRVVYVSSGQVFGFAGGEGTPDYLPVTDAHPLRAARPYGLAARCDRPHRPGGQGSGAASPRGAPDRGRCRTASRPARRLAAATRA